MRILSEQEMDEVFGGQATATVTPTTLDTITVTAPRLSSYGGAYWFGGQGFSSYDESSGNVGGSYYDCGGGAWCHISETKRPALPSVPSPEKMMCIMDAVAEPGADLRTDFRFAIVNSYAYYNPGISYLQLRSTPITTPGLGYNSVDGLTVPTNVGGGNYYYGTTTIYAGGMDGTGGQNATIGSYYNAAGQLIGSYATGPLSGIEEAVITAAHEARHQYTTWNPALLGGHDAEADARTHGIKALEKFRAGLGQSCN